MLVFAPLTLTPAVVAGLGVRAGWPPMPWWCAVIGVLVNAASGSLWAWSMAAKLERAFDERTERCPGQDKGPVGGASRRGIEPEAKARAQRNLAVES